MMTELATHDNPTRAAGIRRRRAMASAAFVALAIAAPAYAQAANEAGSDQPGDGEIIVTAQKRNERLQDVPISIAALSGASLEQPAIRGTSDALKTVPGVAVTENYLGGGSTIAVRGVTSGFPTLTGASAVAYYLDTVPFGLVKSAVAPDANAFDLDRVEVLRGPQGTLYGSSALNGVIRILTRDADLDDTEVKLRLTGSSTDGGAGNYRGDAAVNLPLIADKLAVRAVVGYQDDSGWIDQPNRRNANDREVQTYRLKVNAQPDPNLTIGLSAWISRSDSDMPSFGIDYDRTSSVLDQPAIVDYDAYGAKIAYSFPGFTLASMTSYLKFTNEGTLGLDVVPFNAPNTVFFNGIKSDIFAQEVLLNSTSSGPWRWSAGAIYRRGTEKLRQYYTGAFAVIPEINNRNLSKSYAVFGEVTRSFLDNRLELTLGLRHFHDDESRVDQTGIGAPKVAAKSVAKANTPRIVLTWHPDPNIMTYASYSRGFRSGFPQTDAVLSTSPGFPAVEPDKLDNYEIGSKGRLFGGLASYDLSIFYIDWKDIQQLVTVPFAGGPGFPALVNGEAARGGGVDFALSVRPAKGLTVTGNLSYNALKMKGDVVSAGQVLFRKGDRPNGSPKLTMGGAIDYGTPIGSSGYDLTASLSGNYTSPQSYRSVALGPVLVATSDKIFVSRASIALNAPAGWSATLFVDNLNNEHGTASRTFVGVDDWNARLRPRTIGIQLDFRYK